MSDLRVFLLSLSLLLSAGASIAQTVDQPSKQDVSQSLITAAVGQSDQVRHQGERDIAADQACRRISDKLFSVKLHECLALNMRSSGGYSVKGFPILIKEYPPLPTREPLGRVLLLGGVHGDELTSVSGVFKWMGKLEKYHSGMFHWHVVPMVNPDGVLRKKSRRVNSNGVDLNRNLPTPNWHRESRDYWVKRTRRDPRRYPGPLAGSEPENQWLLQEIESFQPDVIISTHAPFKLVDYDAPDRSPAPRKIGSLRGRLLGTFPGSLGNYAGVQRGIPVVTLELGHAWRMPSSKEITHMWVDLVGWLKTQVPVAKEYLDRNRDGIIAK